MNRLIRAAVFWTILIISTLFAKGLYNLAKEAWTRRDAPGDKTRPGQSQDGKSGSHNRGGTFYAPVFFKHYA